MLNCRLRAVQTKSSSAVLLPLPCVESEEEEEQQGATLTFVDDA
jgi:hypothetical protein